MNLRILLLALCVMLLLVGTASAWYDDNWEYRKSFTLNNSGSNLTNYQVMFTVNRSAGSDTGFTVFLNGECESDYDDIRFVGADDTTVWDYWIESSSATVATIWVEVPSIPNSTAYGSTTGCLYYGNSLATSESSGSSVFDFFDDFTGTSLNATKWTRHGTSYGTVSLADGEITLSATGGSGQNHGIHSTTTPMTAGYILEARSKNTAGWHDVVIGCADDPYYFAPHGDASTDGFSWYARVGDVSSISYRSGANSVYSSEDNLGTAYKNYKIVWESASSVKFYKDGILDYTISSSSYIPSFNLPVYFSQDGYVKPSTLVIDRVLVRKYTATEPTVSTWGSEEMLFPNYISVDFSGVPTSGYVPLTVYYTDASIGYNNTPDTWAWSFGDSSANSTQQNPAHTYTTSGLYNVILTVTNTSFSKTNTTQKTAYINATVNLDAPSADFTVTETCGDNTDTFYFIDFSTGGGLYAWNWSFGDGSYSELRNPTHQYSANGTYSVNLSVWGAFGTDSLLRDNLITIPCGAPTPTPTATPTGTGGNVTQGNVTYILAPDQDYVPFPIWLAIVIVSIAMFGHSIIFLRNSDLTAMMAAVFAFISAWLSNMIGYIDVQVTSFAEEIVISPVIQAVHPPWLVYTMLIFAFVSVVNIFAAIYKVYLKPRNWNEIYDRKTPKWQRRK